MARLTWRQAYYSIMSICLEGRRSIQLSYGRTGYVDSKSFIAGDDTILDALSICREGQTLYPTELKAHPWLFI